MDIKEFNKVLDGYKSQLESANGLKTEIDGREEELIEVIKQEMKKRGVNAIKIDLYGEIGESVDIDGSGYEYHQHIPTLNIMPLRFPISDKLRKRYKGYWKVCQKQNEQSK